MPTPRNCSAHVLVDDLLYVIGGRNEVVGEVDAVEMYAPLTDQWETVVPMRQKRYGPVACASRDGFIYVFGGFNSRRIVESVERYEPKANTWTEVSCLQ